MTDSKGCGDPVVNIDGGKDQVTYSRDGVPYTTGATNVSPDIQHAQDGDYAERTDAIDIIVYFPDKTGVQVKVRDGQNIEAGELFELVMGVMEFPAEARESFSLWLVSDLLELQLKPTHVPFKLVCYWEELLEKYTTAPGEHLQRDEPVIMFRRNVFYSRDAEKRVFFLTEAEQNGKLTGLLRYLYWEAKRNVLDGRYPFESRECDDLAGIQALITRKEMENDRQVMDAGFGSAHYLKSRLTDYLPQHFCKRHWIKTRDNPENRIANAYAQESNNLQYSSLHSLYQQYLGKCHEHAYYGSAFFRGQAEHPVKGIVSKVLSTKDDPVYVAINVEGVFIIDMDDFALLIGIYYENLSWQVVESESIATNPNCLPCLFLQFPDEDSSGTNNTKLLQIFSREAILMDNLIEACVELKKALRLKKSREESHVIYGKGNIAETFKRLSFMRFNSSGQELDRTIRRPKQPTSASAAAANV